MTEINDLDEIRRGVLRVDNRVSDDTEWESNWPRSSDDYRRGMLSGLREALDIIDARGASTDTDTICDHDVPDGWTGRVQAGSLDGPHESTWVCDGCRPLVEADMRLRHPSLPITWHPKDGDPVSVDDPTDCTDPVVTAMPSLVDRVALAMASGRVGQAYWAEFMSGWRL